MLRRLPGQTIQRESILLGSALSKDLYFYSDFNGRDVAS